MRRACTPLVLACVLGLLAGGVVRLEAQTVTGSISGAVADQTDQVLPGVTVTLVNDATGVQRVATTGDAGAFLFAAVQPGTYTVRIEMTGFSPLERRNTVLPAGETLTLGTMKLTVGGMSETITLTAQGSLVQAQSSDRSAS